MSKIEVNQISSQCGSTLTIGQSGDTIQLACGATQTGFGRTGTVDWDTTAKTASFTAVSGNGYFVNTTSGAITLTLPASPSAGDIVAFKDYAFTFATNNLTVNGNGSPIGGVDGTVNPTYNTNGTSKTFIYVDGTKGWLVTNESTDTSQEQNPLYITATGGTIVCCGDYKTHIFTGPGTFTVTCGGNPAGSDSVDYLVIAGGGSSGGDNGGGGGAGGFRVSNFYGLPSPTMSPLSNPTNLPVTAQGYPITIGAGGASSGVCVGTSGPPGSPSVFSTIVSAGGGRSAETTIPTDPADSGGSGGGGTFRSNPSGAGNTPPVSPPQGNPGGIATGTSGGNDGGGGGGGAGAAGQNGGPLKGGDGGIGSYIDDSFIGPTAPSYGESGPVSSTRYFAGGGGGGNQPGPTAPYQGVGGIGGGGDAFQSVGFTQQDGVTNTGGGAGSGNPGGASTSGSGGSGIVIIRYKYQ